MKSSLYRPYNSVCLHVKPVNILANRVQQTVFAHHFLTTYFFAKRAFSITWSFTAYHFLSKALFTSLARIHGDRLQCVLKKNEVNVNFTSGNQTLEDHMIQSSANETGISPTTEPQKIFISLGVLVGGMIAARFGESTCIFV